MKGFLDNLINNAKLAINNKILDLTYGKPLLSPAGPDEYEKQGYRKVSEDGKPYYINPQDMSSLHVNPYPVLEQPAVVQQVKAQEVPERTPAPRGSGPFRHPDWEKWKMQSPKSFEQLLSGTEIASKETGVPQDLLMDISGIETSGGQFMNQMSGGPGKGFFQFEEPPIGVDPYSATDSARLAANEIKNRRLSRWGTPKGEWGSLDNVVRRAEKDRISTYYTPEELNKYLVPEFQF